MKGAIRNKLRIMTRRVVGVRAPNYFSYQRISKQVTEYGYPYSKKNYLLSLVTMLIVLAGFGVLYQLKPALILVVQFVGLACIPILIRNHYLSQSRLKQFNDVDIYLHQMLYSFQRQAKISVALEDTQKVVDRKLADQIQKAREQIQYGDAQDIYTEALTQIENVYPCARIKTMHRFLIRIEKKGGDYDTSLAVLLSDFDHWVKGVYQYQEEIQHMKKNATIGVGISFLLAASTVLIGSMLKGFAEIGISITQEPIYQVSSVIFMILQVLYFTYTQVSYNRDWLEQGRNEKSIQRDYQMAFETQVAQVRYHALPLYGLVVIAAVILFLLQFYFIAFSCIVFVVILLYIPELNKRGALRHLKCDLYLAFSEWLREVALNLQHEPLLASIEDTYEECPTVMKKPLKQFIFDLEENPAEVTPYYEFLHEFQILDISSTIKILYSMSEIEGKNVDGTINTLIQRNYELVGRYQELKARDTISVMKFTEYIPAFFVSMKIAVDMLVIVTVFL